MRLLFLTDRLSDRGGADHHLAQVVGEAVRTGRTVTLGYGRDEGGFDVPQAVVLRRIRGLASMVDSRARLGGLAELLARADVIHLQNVMNPSVVETVVRGGRAVVTVQDHRVFCPGRGRTLPDGSVCVDAMGDETCRECLPDGEYRRSTIELTRRRLEALQGAEAVIVLSAFMARELAGAGVDGAAVVPPWVDCGPIRTEAGGHFLLGGRLVAHKGVADGWRAWNEARRPLPLVVAGSGPLEHELVGTHRRGWLSPTELRAELRRARALIFASGWQEPLGILGIEALAEGTPVIVAESGGTGEWSAAGCLRVPAGDVPAMADAIRRLAADPDLALDLGKAGQESVRELFARERIWPVLEEVYTRVAAV